MIRNTELYVGKKKQYKFTVMITTYELVMKDKSFFDSINWKYLIVDEAHRLKNNEGLLYDILLNISTQNKMLITGTPLQNTLKELWSLLHFLHPDDFDDFEEFEATYPLDESEKITKMHQDLKPYLLRRMKKDVEKSTTIYCA